MKHTVTLLATLVLVSETASAQSLEIGDLETRVIAKEEGRWFIDRNLLIQGFLSGRRSCGV